MPPKSPPPPADNSASERSRVASFLAQAEASRNAIQIQTATADSSVSTHSKKNRRRFVVIASIIVLALAAIIVFTVINKPASPKNIAETFQEYKNYLENGPSSQNQGSTWFIFTIAQSDLADNQIISYTEELNKKYSVFLNHLTKAKGGYSEELITRAQTYAGTLNAVTGLSALPAVDAEIYQLATKNSFTTIDDLITKIIPNPSLNNTILSTLHQYLTSRKAFLEMYINNGCVAGQTIDFECNNISKSNPVYTDYVQAYDSMTIIMSQNMAELQESFMAETKTISDEVLQHD